MRLTGEGNVRYATFAATCLALNLTLGKAANLLGLPFAFDTVGTILGAILVPWPYLLAVCVGSSLLGGLLINPVFPFYLGTQLAIGLAAILANRWGAFKKVHRAIFAGFLIGILSAIVSAPVTALVFQGVAVPSITAVNVLLLTSGRSLWESVITGALIVETGDKVVAAILVYLVISRLPERLRPAGARARDER